MSTIEGVQHIGFTKSRAGKAYFSTYNPLDQSNTAWQFAEATEQEIEQAVAKAKAAYPIFSGLSAGQRAVFLEGIADEMEEVKQQVINVYCQESGLPEGRANGEFGRTIGQLRKFAVQARSGRLGIPRIDTGDADRQPMRKPDLRKGGLPLGPVVVFGASNFPLAYSTAGGDTASALAAGCPVIVKGHPLHAGTGELVASAIVRAAKKCEMPDGVFSHLQGSSHSLGQKLTQHPDVKAVGFTGSQKGGRALMDLAASRSEPIPVFAEMGSINPVVFMPSGLQGNLAAYWAEQYAQSITLGVGQFCTNPGLLVAQKGDALEAFKKLLAERLSTMSLPAMIHPSLGVHYSKNQAVIGAVQGVEVLHFSQNGQTSIQFSTLSSADFLEQASAQTEVFGPSSLLVECENLQDLLKVIDSLEGQLTGSLIYDSKNKADLDVVQNHLGARVGRVIHNGVPTGVEVCDAMQHGGPYPASADARFGAVGGDAVDRWLRPLSYQNCPDELLPPELQNSNPLGLLRLVNGQYTKDPIE
jgi:NADP-dependent aldehyde dehydrogenase